MLVYIREAHAVDGWRTPRNDKEGVFLETAKTFDQKEGYATMCVRKLDVKFPAVVDGMDHKVESDYTAWPDRLYMVGRDGKIAWKGRPGPRGFRVEELEQAISKELSR